MSDTSPAAANRIIGALLKLLETFATAGPTVCPELPDFYQAATPATTRCDSRVEPRREA